MSHAYFTTEISHTIWDAKYRWRHGAVPVETTVADTWQRIAGALATVESEDRPGWEQRFYRALEGFKFLPGGRIHAGAGTGHNVTLFNCFVMGTLEDSMDGIFDGLKEGALTMQQGGGVGYDFSTLRPAGFPALRTGTTASGPVSFMRIWDAMCGTILSTGARRGAMMATLRCDHPDIETFVKAKGDPHQLRRFNVSVQVTDAFLAAVRADAEWPLVFPDPEHSAGEGEMLSRQWPGYDGEVSCRVVRKVRAKALWDTIMRSTYEYAEPGVLFVDRVNRLNNLWYREHISATNPCGEIPLPPYGACDLGSINLTRFVQAPFSQEARLDFDGVRRTVEVAVRMMDNAIDASRFPVEAQAEQARGTRRIGLGLTGLADTLILLGMHYGTGEARRFAASVMKTICLSAYRTSIVLAREKGPFPFLEKEKFLNGAFVQSLPEDIREGIARDGIRNGLLTAIAPTGTISLLANNISSGLEPVFDFNYRRRVLDVDGNAHEHSLTDYALRLWRELNGDEPTPETFVDARALAPEAHLDMQASLQPYVDNAISKTINIPAEYPFEAFKAVYEQAYDKGLKGCTTFRPNPVTGAVLEAGLAGEPSACCGIEREAD